MTTDTARRIAGDWHSGQGSPLYAYSSSGTIISGLDIEIERAIADATYGGNYPAELADLLAFVRPEVDLIDWRADARERGEDAAKAAASWVADGNSDRAGIVRLLEMMGEGDPEVYDRLPNAPNLSGEWADDPTPESLALEILPTEAFLTDPADLCEIIGALADAFEDGVSETFESACESELRAHLGIPETLTFADWRAAENV